MPKVVPAASFRHIQQPTAASGDEIAAFVARAGAQASPPSNNNAPDEIASEITATSPVVAVENAAVKLAIAVPPPPSLPSEGGGWRSKTVRRTDGRELRKQTFYLDASISRRLAQHCSKYQYEQSRAVERAVLALLESSGD